MPKSLLVALVAVLTLCGGCAVFNRDNTPVLNFVEDKLLPETKPARYIVFPLLVPVSLAAVTIDAVIVRPIDVADDAVLDTKDALWKDFYWSERYVTECLLLVPRTVLTPAVLAGCFLARSTLDIEPRGGEPRLRERHRAEDERREKEQAQSIAAEKIASAAVALGEKRYHDALTLAEEAYRASGPEKDTALALKAAALLELRDIDGFGRLMRGSRITLEPEILAPRIAGLLAQGTPRDQIALLIHLDRSAAWSDNTHQEVTGALEALLGAEDRAVAMKALDVLRHRINQPAVRRILERIAKGDDPVLATAAAAYLK